MDGWACGLGICTFARSSIRADGCVVLVFRSSGIVFCASFYICIV
jgi:hypothetical protein